MIFWYWILFFSSSMASENVLIDKISYLSVEDWAEKIQFQSFIDQKSGRILFEKKDHDSIIFLLNSPYALKGSDFLTIPHPPIKKGTKIFLSVESARRVFSGLLKEGDDRESNQKISLENSKCMNQKKIKKVFLDPGHGGEDYGTKRNGVNEKDIVLKFSRLAADELRRRGFEVSYSRTKDVFLPLDIRSKFAFKWKADIFISLHVNSSPSSEAHGTETYILNQDATDAEARKLALIENSIVQEVKEKQSAVQDILWDMEQTQFLQESAYLAASIQRSIVTNAHALLTQKNEGDWNNRGVRQAPFFVLNRAAMPAVLVELGYLSNRRDRKLLTEKTFQERLAKALAEGVLQYKRECKTF